MDGGQMWLLDGLVDPVRGPANPAGRGGGAEALSPQQAKFVDRYVVHFNASKAAAEAGYSERTARQIGSRLLSNVVISAEIRRRVEELRRGAQLSVVGVLEQLRRLAYSDIRTLYRDNMLLPVAEWPVEISARIAGVETEELFEWVEEPDEETGKKRKVRVLKGYAKKVKLWNPNESLGVIARYLGMLIEQKRNGLNPEGAIDADYDELSVDELREQARRIAARADAA